MTDPCQAKKRVPPKQYISAVGFMNREQVEAALASMLPNCPALLSVGVMMSPRTLAGKTNALQEQFPLREDVARIFGADPREMGTLHFASRLSDVTRLGLRLHEACQISGPCLRALQLDICWPLPREIECFLQRWRHIVTILQVGPEAIQECGRNPFAIAHRLTDYRSCINHALIDASGGYGLPLDPTFMRACILAIKDTCPNMGITVAGGLGPDTLDTVHELVAEFLDISLDAQGLLCHPGDKAMDTERMCAYVQRASQLVISVR